MSELNVASMRRQQFILGWLCTLLPFISLGFGLIGHFVGCNPEHWWYSISATYYSNSGIIMIGLLTATTIYFWSYRGYDKIDDWITKLCAGFSFIVVAFPCNIHSYDSMDVFNPVGLFCIPAILSQFVHCIAAACLYITFGIMMIRFRKSSGYMTKMKKVRNVIYLIFFIILISCGVLIFLKDRCHWPGYTTIIIEIVAQLSFGLSWLIKSEAFKFLNDEELVKEAE